MGSGVAWTEALAGSACLAAALVALPSAGLAPSGSTTPAPAPVPVPAAAPAPNVDVRRPEHAPLVASYTLRARLDAERHVIGATGTIVWTNPSRTAARELYLHLYLNAFKNEKSLFLRSPFGAGRSGSRAHGFGYVDIQHLKARELGNAELWPPKLRHTPGDPDDETSLRCELPGEVAPGQTLTLDIEFSAQLPEIVERTGYSGDYHFVAQWFPKLAKREADGTWVDFAFHAQSEFYADFGDYDVTLDVPENMVVGASGMRVATRRDKGRREDRYVARGVHDFAWTAWPSFEETHEHVAGVAVRLLYPPGRTSNAETTLQTLRFALPFFERHYGAYPYPTLTVVDPPSGGENTGGMEYPTLITTGGPWYAPLSGVHAVEAVTIHELGHQWFYGLLASDEHRYPFLDEGVNTYAENHALTTAFGEASLVRIFGLTISGPNLSRTFAAAREQDAAVALPARDFPGFRSMAALVYSRTGTILETLARVYGRERLSRALSLYAERFRFQSPEPKDFVACIQSELGEAAAAALTRALFERGTIDFLVRDVQNAADSEPTGVFDREHGRETVVPGPNPAQPKFRGRAVVFRHGSVELPVDVEFIDEHGQRTRQHWDGRGAFREFEWNGSSRLISVVVDPDHRVLLDGNLLNNATSSSSSSSPRVFERGLYAFELLLGGLLP